MVAQAEEEQRVANEEARRDADVQAQSKADEETRAWEAQRNSDEEVYVVMAYIVMTYIVMAHTT